MFNPILFCIVLFTNKMNIFEKLIVVSEVVLFVKTGKYFIQKYDCMSKAVLYVEQAQYLLLKILFDVTEIALFTDYRKRLAVEEQVPQ